MRTWLSGYLSTLVMIPVVLLILVIGTDIVRSLDAQSDASYTVDLGNLLEKTSAVIHEMQKERGMSAGFISSKGANFATALPRQRQLLDSKLAEFNEFLSENSFDDDTQGELDTLSQRLKQLARVRSEVSNQSIAIGEMLGYYTENNRIMIELTTVMAHKVSDAKTSTKFETLYNVASIKENSGIERAVLSSAFGIGQFNPALYKRYITLLVKQETYLKSGELMADEEYLATLRKFKTSPEEKKVREYRAAAENTEQMKTVNAEDWFAASTARINLLKADEELLITQIIDLANETNSENLAVVIFEFILLAVTFFLTYVILRTLSIRGEQTEIIDTVTTQIVRDRDISGHVEIIDRGELGNIAKDINDTMESLSNDFNSFQTSATEVVDASQNTSVIVEETSANLHSMREHINHLMETFNSLNTHIMSDIAKIGDAEDMASQVAAGAKEGASSVTSAAAQINDMASEVDSVGEAMKHLNERVNDILGMVDVIRSVAEQTNLLALNAAIEAARAGEQGRGFAVVADEVRSLAQRTQESTEEIARVVDDLMSSSQNAINAIEVGNDKAQEAVKSVDSINGILNQVAMNITDLDGLTSEISDSAKQQMQQITLLSAKVLDIDNMADENAKGGESIATAAVQLFNLSSDMMTKIQSYKTSGEVVETNRVTAPTSLKEAGSSPQPTKSSNTDDDDNIEFF